MARDIWHNYGPDANAPLLHGTAIENNGDGLLILGPSGSGKSGLALQMIAMGCKLVADDRVQICVEQHQLKLECPAAVKNKIEARNVGLLTVKTATRAICKAIVDLSKPEPKRHPDPVIMDVQGVQLRYLKGKDVPNLASVLMIMLTSGGLAA